MDCLKDIGVNPSDSLATVLDGIFLNDGTPVVARSLVAGDRKALADAYRRLSPEARYNRFWTHGGDVIGEKMLDRVLRQDPETHVSWAVLDPARDFPPMGAASWWRKEQGSSQAEFSAVVLDGDQGRGVGTLLLAVLWCLGRRSGIKRLVAYSLAENRQAADWMRDTGAVGHWNGHELVFVWNLDAHPKADGTRAMRDLHARIGEFEARLG